MNIAGKLALVTGASSGIGKATARLLAKRGARVLLVARSRDKLQRLASTIKAHGGQVNAYATDLSDASAVHEMASAVRGDFGIPDIIVNNAGAGKWMPVVETSAEDARKMIELPYLASFYVTREFLADMMERGSGHIVNVTSVASYLAWPNASGYIAARHALKGFNDALRTETEGTGVNVTLIVMGTVESPYWEHNPSSREKVPKGIPGLTSILTTEDAAALIIKGIESEARRLVRPWIFRLLFVLYALFPDQVRHTMKS